MFGVKFDEESKTWRTNDIPLVYNTSISLGHILLRSMELFGPRIAQVAISKIMIFILDFFDLLKNALTIHVLRSVTIRVNASHLMSFD